MMLHFSRFKLKRKSKIRNSTYRLKVSIKQIFDERTIETYEVDEKKPRDSIKKIKINADLGLITNPIHKMSAYFLPKGYPSTVKHGYLKYVKGQMTSSVFSTASGILSMQTMLYAIGLGTG